MTEPSYGSDQDRELDPTAEEDRVVDSAEADREAGFDGPQSEDEREATDVNTAVSGSTISYGGDTDVPDDGAPTSIEADRAAAEDSE